MEKILRYAFELISFALNGTAVSEETKAALNQQTYERLFQVTNKYDLAHIVAEALDRNELYPTTDPAAAMFTKARRTAIYRYERMRYDCEQISQAFESAKIPYLPLKGMVLREYYKEPWFRTSCDIDVLVRETDLERAAELLKDKYGYTQATGKTLHDLSLYSISNGHLELHFRLIEIGAAEKAEEKILSEVWERSELVKGSEYRYSMTDEMFYFFHVLHMAKHFRSGGCGIRPFLDLWLLDRQTDRSTEKRLELLERGGLRTFAVAASELADAWLSGKELSDEQEQLQKFLLETGMYGNTERRVMIQQQKKGGARYVLGMIFLPYRQLKLKYPVLVKWPILYPFLTVWRWICAPFKRKRWRQHRAQLKLLSENSEKKQTTAELLKRLEL
ncbi:MAG: nucleotidyltransferase family protein [Clostridia bacterium]|nr:nucleotidyltransferase family protein [Clostridia bacterium]